MPAKSQGSIRTGEQADKRWDDVRVFLAAFRYGSLAAAAARLGLDTSTVSRRLASFESALGVRLFERTRDGIRPTRAAANVLAAAESMEAAHARIARDVADTETEPEGIVRISAAPGFADIFVAPALVRLRRRYPRLSVEIDASVQARDLTRQEADIAIRSVPPKGADLVITKLGSGRWIPATSPELAEELGRVSSWSDAPWIVWDRDLGSFPPARWVATHASKAQVVLRTSHFASQIVAGRTGLGVLLVPEPYLAACGLVPVRFAKPLQHTTEAVPEAALWLVGHRVLRDSPRVAAVWTFLADELRRRMRA